MSDNKLVRAVIEAATLTGLAVGIGWAAKKVVKENYTSDPSNSPMNYVKFTAVIAPAFCSNSTLRTKKSFQPASEINDLNKKISYILHHGKY